MWMMTGTSLFLFLLVVEASIASPSAEPEGNTEHAHNHKLDAYVSTSSAARSIVIEFEEDASQRFHPHNLTLPETPLDETHPSLPIDYEAPEICTEIYHEMVIQQRLMQTYRCPKMDRFYSLDDQCLKSACGQKLNSDGFYEKCQNGTDHHYIHDAFQMACVEKETAANCGTWGVYGPVLGYERESDASCVCQLLHHHSLKRLNHAQELCPQFLPKLLCIPNLVTAISTCSWPGSHEKDILKCIEYKMDRDNQRGVSIPLCYIQMCHALEFMFNKNLTNCRCEGRVSKRVIGQREWYRHPSHNNTGNGDDLQLLLPLSSRDVTYSLPHADQLSTHFFTDHADPQSCGRFIRCFNNGPCFNGTDGGYCPPGEHFKAFPGNVEKNGCYPASEVNCGNIPVTKDSLGLVPVCFGGNEDFSDVVESVGRIPAAIRAYVGTDGTLQGLGFGYHARYDPGQKSVWSPVHGASAGNETIRTLQLNEEIRAVYGETINSGSKDQQVAKVRFDIFNKLTGAFVESTQYGEVPADKKDDITTLSWTMAYPDAALQDSSLGCAIRFICGSKTKDKIQVLTIHFSECVYSKPRDT